MPADLIAFQDKFPDAVPLAQAMKDVQRDRLMVKRIAERNGIMFRDGPRILISLGSLRRLLVGVPRQHRA